MSIRKDKVLPKMKGSLKLNDLKNPKILKTGILSPVSPDKKTLFNYNATKKATTTSPTDSQEIKLDMINRTASVSLQSNLSIDTKRENTLRLRAFDLLDKSLHGNTRFRNNFTLSRILGWGGIGVVVQAMDTKTRQTVAIKIIKRKNSTPAELIMKDLRHKGIIRLYESFQDDNAYFLVLEKFGKCWDPESELKAEMFRATGYFSSFTLPIANNTSSTLFEYIESSPHGRVPFKFIKSLFMQVASAVDYLHSLGIVHADLKEENILIDIRESKLVSKLCDFGHSFKYDGKPRMRIYGTKVLTSPELLGHLIYDDCKDPFVQGFPQDIWALGLLFYTMIYGQLPPENDKYLDGDIDLSGHQYYPTSFEALKNAGL